ncbi:hypothetical protein ACFLU6_04535, partial [Acidobacteriota bacterium]
MAKNHVGPLSIRNEFWPGLVPENMLDIVWQQDIPNILPDPAALQLDGSLRPVARTRAVLDRQMGRRLARLRDIDGLKKLGFVRLGDYATERLELSVRSAQEMARVAGDLEKLPALRRASDEGRLLMSHVRELVRVVTPETEQAWIDKAEGLTVRQLRHEIKRYKQEQTLAVPAMSDESASSLLALASAEAGVLTKAEVQEKTDSTGDSSGDSSCGSSSGSSGDSSSGSSGDSSSGSSGHSSGGSSGDSSGGSSSHSSGDTSGGSFGDSSDEALAKSKASTESLALTRAGTLADIAARVVKTADELTQAGLSRMGVKQSEQIRPGQTGAQRAEPAAKADQHDTRSAELSEYLTKEFPKVVAARVEALQWLEVLAKAIASANATRLGQSEALSDTWVEAESARSRACTQTAFMKSGLVSACLPEDLPHDLSYGLSFQLETQSEAIAELDALIKADSSAIFSDIVLTKAESVAKEQALERPAPSTRCGLAAPAGPDDRSDKISVAFQAPPWFRAKWKTVVDLFRKVEGRDDIPEGAAAEAFAAEWISGIDLPMPDEPYDPDKPYGPRNEADPYKSIESPPVDTLEGDDDPLDGLSWQRTVRQMREIWMEENTCCWQWLNEEEQNNEKKPLPEWLNALSGPLSCDPFELDRELVMLEKARRTLNAMLGRMLLNLSRVKLTRKMGFVDMSHYVREMLGIGASTARRLKHIERRMYDLPEYRDAYYGGEIGLAKINLLLRVECANSTSKKAWLERAEGVTVRRLGREVQAVLQRVDLIESGILELEPGEDELGVLPEGIDLERYTSALGNEACNVDTQTQTGRSRMVSIRISMEPGAARFFCECISLCRELAGPDLMDWECADRFLDAFVSQYADQDKNKYALNYMIFER